MVKQLLFAMRHGETRWNAEGRFQGRSDRIMSVAGTSVSAHPSSRRFVIRINPPKIAMQARCVDSTIGYTSRDSRTAVKS